MGLVLTRAFRLGSSLFFADSDMSQIRMFQPGSKQVNIMCVQRGRGRACALIGCRHTLI